MTLVEVMILMTVLSLIALGTTTLMRTTIQIQMKGDLTERLLQVRANLIQTIEDDNAWALTISNYAYAHSTGLGCLRDGSTVPCNNDPAPRVNQNFNIRTDGDGTGAASIYYAGEQATTGIAPNGQFCTTFSTGTGDDLCPFRYNFDLQFTCPTGQLTCSKPKVQVFGRFVSNPLSRDGILARLNLDSLDFVVEKSSQVRYEPLVIRHYSTSNSGGGSCVAGGKTARDLTEVFSDSAGNVLDFNSAVNRFRLKKGDYTCHITAQVHNIPSGFSISLEQATGGPNPIVIPITTAYTEDNTSIQVSGTIRLNLSEDSPWLHLLQYCTQSNSSFDMGIPTENYAQGSSFTTIHCVRTS